MSSVDVRAIFELSVFRIQTPIFFLCRETIGFYLFRNSCVKFLLNHNLSKTRFNKSWKIILNGNKLFACLFFHIAGIKIIARYTISFSFHFNQEKSNFMILKDNPLFLDCFYQPSSARLPPTEC